MRDDLFDEDFEINNENLTELKLRCFNQDYEAMYLLAKYYLKNKDSIEDISVIIKLLEKASDNGIVRAATLLGNVYKYGCKDDYLPNDEDIIKAITWYKKAVEQNDPIAMYELALIYLTAHDDDRLKATEGFELALNSAEQGYNLAQYLMGLLYLEGYHVPYNNVEALSWLEKAADNNCVDSLVLLGRLYFQGNEVEQDYDKAFLYSKKAADLNSAEGMFSLGRCYDEGIGVEHDPYEAFKWLNKAAELGNVNAIFIVGNHYEKGDGCKQSYSKAIEYYNLLAESGYPSAITHLGYLYHVGRGVKKDLKKAFKLFNDASKLNDEEATHFLYICFRDGLGVDKDEKKALKYLKKAAKLDCPESLFELALAYFQGNYGLKINENKCIECLIRAAELGLKEAEDILEELKK